MREVIHIHSGKSNSPFRYAGRKFYARKVILPHIPKTSVYCEPFAGGASIFFAKEPAGQSILNDLDTSVYCEPFAGGASIFFAKEPAGQSILNDLDTDVMNTFVQIRDNLDRLLGLLDGIPATKKLHAHYKNTYKPSDDLERAFRWYYLNRTSYSGIMKRENCYFGYGAKYSMRPENWPHHLRMVSNRLQGVKLTSLDFEDCIDTMPDGAFLFVDPPYFNADQKKFYPCHFELRDHIYLMACLQRNADRLSLPDNL